jgi:hypothetical protein
MFFLVDEQSYSVDTLSTIVDRFKSGKASEITYDESKLANVVMDENSAEFDKRKLFPKLFEDALNTSDPDAVRSVLSASLSDGCGVDSIKIDISEGDKGKEILEGSTNGTEAVIQYFIGYVVAVPDSLFLVHEWKLFPRAFGCSSLVIKFSFTGSKVFELPIKQSCGGSYTHGTSQLEIPLNYKHSIKFRERSRTCKYDNRKRQKKITLGEHVESNMVTEGHLVSVREIVNSNSCSSSDDNSTSADSLDKSEDSADIGLLIDPSVVNIQGILRFNFDASNKIFRIQCLHLHGHTSH